jgi:hypothetical protein
MEYMICIAEVFIKVEVHYIDHVNLASMKMI